MKVTGVNFFETQCTFPSQHELKWGAMRTQEACASTSPSG